MKIRNEDINSLKVTSYEEDKKTADKARNQVNLIPLATVIGIILVVSSCSIKELNKSKNKNTQEIPVIVMDDEINNNISNKNIKDNTISENKYEVKKYEVDYSNVTSFFNHIIENRNKYGTFAESFQNENDVKNLVNFINSFNELYSDIDLETTIKTQDEFDEIISDYYKSCVEHDIKGQMHILYPSDSKANTLLNESEELAFNLKNGTDKDYTIANEYYTWMLKNVIDGRTNINQESKNAPLIETLRWQYENYRYSGNMLNARKYQKNDSLPVDGVDIYYSYKNYYEGEYVETQNSFTCPDWGVDNIMSPTEEITETKLVIEEEGQRLFKQVEEIFSNKLRGKTK